MRNDYFTNTVEDAAEYERRRSIEEHEYYEKFIDDSHEEEEYNDDDCNCSDPGCPCGGHKIGGL